ncbi:hypothetical protein HG431_000315 [Candidatus Saccharibacteria bacterium]|nr:hypothetical protein [Candidatus Saccharibacteria bacterium]
MNATATAVIVIVIAAFVLAVMAGVGGYTVGRARAANDAKKADERLHKTLVDCKDKTIRISELLRFQLEQTERYNKIARRAVELLPSDNIQTPLLERKLQEADSLLSAKLAEIKRVTKG